MYRKSLIELLENNPLGISEIAEISGSKFTEIEEDLKHLARSLKHQDYRLVIQPAECLDCHFKFKPDKLLRPVRCPICKQQHITEPLIFIEKIH